MATTLLGNKKVGDVIKIKENGVDVRFIIVHKGLPSEMYDNSCDGVWVLREQAHSERVFDVIDNDYENSDIQAWLNSEYLNSIDPNIRSFIKSVKIPFRKGGAYGSKDVYSGEKGLLCKVFLLAYQEVGFTDYVIGNTSYEFAKDGAKLGYFDLINPPTTREYPKGVAKQDSGKAVLWWMRTPYTINTYVSLVGTTGVSGSNYVYLDGVWARPAFILPSDLAVNSNGAVTFNAAPEITANKSGNLGTLTDGFDVEYSVNDAEGDTVTVNETLDSENIRSFEAVLDQTETCRLRDNDWLKVANGSHTFKISASDGIETTEHSITFARNQTSLFVTLKEPLTADDNIAVCMIKVDGSIPTDAVCKYEVTNNALDSSPAWEDCTEEVKAGRAHVFKSKGSALSFRVSIKRGHASRGGYITQISGGYE